MVDSQVPGASARVSARQLMATMRARQAARARDGRPLGLVGLMHCPPTSHQRIARGRRNPAQMAVAMGVAAALVGGGVWAWWTAQNISAASHQSIVGPEHHIVVGPASPDTASPPGIPDLPSGSTQWAASVQRTLGSTATQLRQADSAEHAWDALPAANRTGPAPSELAVLRTHRVDLAAQQKSLRAMLHSWTELKQTHSSLVDTEGQLSRVTVASSDIGPAGPQYAVLVNQAQTQRKTVDDLLPVVRADMAMPLPDVSSAVDPNTSAVLSAIYARTNHDSTSVSSNAAAARPAAPVQRTDEQSAPVAKPAESHSASEQEYAQQMMREANREAAQLLASLGGQ